MQTLPTIVSCPLRFSLFPLSLAICLGGCAGTNSIEHHRWAASPEPFEEKQGEIFASAFSGGIETAREIRAEQGNANNNTQDLPQLEFEFDEFEMVLHLNEDNTFELNTAWEAAILMSSVTESYRSTGTWELRDDRALVLQGTQKEARRSGTRVEIPDDSRDWQTTYRVRKDQLTPIEGGIKLLKTEYTNVDFRAASADDSDDSESRD